MQCSRAERKLLASQLAPILERTLGRVTLALLRTLCYTLLVVNALLTLKTMHLTGNLSVRL
jgi:hypothetical protein